MHWSKWWQGYVAASASDPFKVDASSMMTEGIQRVKIKMTFELIFQHKLFSTCFHFISDMNRQLMFIYPAFVSNEFFILTLLRLNFRHWRSRFTTFAFRAFLESKVSRRVDWRWYYSTAFIAKNIFSIHMLCLLSFFHCVAVLSDVSEEVDSPLEKITLDHYIIVGLLLTTITHSLIDYEFQKSPMGANIWLPFSRVDSKYAFTPS